MSDGRQNEYHNHRKLIKLITWTTALSNSMKLWAMLCRATQDRRVMVESSDKMMPAGEGKGKPLQYSCLESPMNSIERQKDRTLKDELPRSVKVKVKSLSRVWLWDPMDCSLPGSSVHGIFQAIVLVWVAISFSRGSSWPRDRTQFSHIVDRHLTVWATREVPQVSRCPICYWRRMEK